MSKRIFNVVEYDTYAEIPATMAEGFVHCVEDGKIYCREADGSLHEPTNTGAAVHVHAEYADVDHTHPGGSEAFPVGAVFLSVVSTNPATLLGYGTWSQIAGGRMLVGQTGGDADFDTAEETGGAKTHTLTVNEMPSHTHLQQRHATTTGGLTGPTTAPDTSSSNPQSWGVSTQAAGGGAAFSILNPYFVVYIWKRTA